MASLKLYLIRAVYDWTVDNGFTPHVIVDAKAPGLKAPQGSAENGRLILNIHPRAVDRFQLTDEGLGFGARFGGRAIEVDIPLAAVLAVYAKENGQGISFPDKDDGTPKGTAKGTTIAGRPRRKGPSLKVVK